MDVRRDWVAHGLVRDSENCLITFRKANCSWFACTAVGPFNKEVEWTGEAVGPKQVYIEDKIEIQGDGGAY